MQRNTGKQDKGRLRRASALDTLKPAGTCSNKQEGKYMTNKQIDNRVKKLKELETQQKALEQQAEKIRQELKAELEANEESEHNTGNFVIRWAEIVSNRLDSKALKAALPEVFTMYSKQSTSRRFTIA
jgi:predicted phage-related endonuclease